MSTTELLSKSEAEEHLTKAFIEQTKDTFISGDVEALAKMFAETNFDNVYEPAAQKKPAFQKDKNGRLIKPAYRISVRYKRIIHNNDLKFRINLFAALSPISMIFIQQWAIPTQLITLAVLMINYFSNARKKGAKLNEDLFATIITLKLLEKETKANVPKELLLAKLNEERDLKKLPHFSMEQLNENLEQLKNTKLKDGTVSKFVDSDKKGNWWCVDV